MAGVDAGSIAKGRFKYGDIITHVNGNPVVTVAAARNVNHFFKKIILFANSIQAILSSIQLNRAVTIRIERAQGLKIKSNVELPDDVKAILTRRRGFQNYKHRYAPAIGTTPLSSHHTGNCTTQQETTKTEQRSGTRTPSPSELFSYRVSS